MVRLTRVSLGAYNVEATTIACNLCLCRSSHIFGFSKVEININKRGYPTIESTQKQK